MQISPSELKEIESITTKEYSRLLPFGCHDWRYILRSQLLEKENYEFLLCVKKGFSTKDLDLSPKCKMFSHTILRLFVDHEGDLVLKLETSWRAGQRNQVGKGVNETMIE